MSEICRVELTRAETLSVEQREQLGINVDRGLVVIETRCSSPKTTGKILEGGYSKYLTELVRAAQATTQALRK